MYKCSKFGISPESARNVKSHQLSFSLNYQQHKKLVSANYLFSFIPFVKFIAVRWKMLLNLLIKDLGSGYNDLMSKRTRK